ncbi:alpha/beta fold hydrolase [Rhodococcus sp. KRD162]|uniref:alpha/beta fold hydrolase n=1 Tax=Rhodococcus sp. KRD162 TaxID=2729725 RepID=UPI003CFE6CDE
MTKHRDGYVQLGPVRTWFADTGEGSEPGAPVVLMHPGGVDSTALDVTTASLASAFRVYTPERRGHGRTANVSPMTFAAMASDMIEFLENVVGGPARLAGCSDGAVVALLVALQRPDLVDRLACVAGVFHRDGWGGGVSGGADRSEFARDLDDMHRSAPALVANDLAELAVRTLVMIGDDDEVSIEHAAEFYRSVPVAELAIVPGTSHGLLVEKPALCNAILLDFLTHDPVQTFAPIRRI